MEAIVLLLLAATAFALLLVTVQHVSLSRHLRAPPPEPAQRPPISILKPLCGVDDGLERSLLIFSDLPYHDYEVLLGVRDESDAAWPLARRMAARFPHRFRVVLQGGEPGRNPKVNQLIALERAARHDVLVVSDSNVRVSRDYLDGIAAAFDDPTVGLVTHPILGDGESSLGSLLDHAHLSCDIAPGIVGAKRVAGKDIVVGKSMAIRRADLERLGGFASVKDVLAEDYVLGKRVRGELGMRIALAPQPVCNHSVRRSLRDFVGRYARWSVIHRQAVGNLVYSCELLLNPLVLGISTWVVRPARSTAAVAVAAGAWKMALDVRSASLLRQRPLGIKALALPLKDVLIGAAWFRGLCSRTVDWRGNKLRVMPGTRLEPQRGAEPDPRAPRPPAAPSCAPAPVRIAHLSDLHLGLRGREEAAQALVRRLADEEVELVVVTGDITHRGLVGELAIFERLFAELAQAGRLVVVPGNHDRLGDDVAGSIMAGERVRVTARKDVYLVQLDSTGPHNRSIFRGHGALDHADVEAVERAVSRAPAGALVALLLHHHPLPLPEEMVAERLSSWLGWPFAAELERGWELLERLRGRCDLVLHGHRHVPSSYRLFSEEARPLGVFNAGSSTELGRVRLFPAAAGRLAADPEWLHLALPQRRAA